MSNRYARFECRICGELVYSSIPLEQATGIAAEKSGDRVVELTCSSGHSDQYSAREIKRAVETKPAGIVKGKLASAAFG
jgi:hypothetical protein